MTRSHTNTPFFKQKKVAGFMICFHAASMMFWMYLMVISWQNIGKPSASLFWVFFLVMNIRPLLVSLKNYKAAE